MRYILKCALILLMMIVITGCTKSEEIEVKQNNGSSESITRIDDIVAVEANVSSEDAKEISSLLKSINDDAFTIMKDGKYADAEYSEFAKKYAIDKDNQKEARNFIGYLSYVSDGFDGEYNDKYQKWDTIEIVNRISHYSLFPLDDVKVFFGDDYAKYFTKIKTKLSDITIEDEATDITTFSYVGSYENWKFSNGLINSEWFTDISPALKQQNPDMELIPSYSITFQYVFDKEYPENDIELTSDTRVETNDELLEIIKKPANTLDLMLVKTDKGWRLLTSKWLFSTRNVVNEVSENS